MPDMIILKKKLIPILILFLISVQHFLFCQQNTGLLYKDPDAPIEQRVENLLQRMTIEEKAIMVNGKMLETRQIERLGIPALKMTDGPMGIRPFGPEGLKKASAFPAGVAMAATWNPELIYKLGQALGEEAKSFGIHILLGPCINIHRLPQGGRNFESFGEDPHLTSQIAISYIKGVQSENVVATTKHFACNNQEYYRLSVNTIIDERTLNEIYFPAFKASVQEGKTLAVMSAYNRLNGQYCSSNSELLTNTLKKEWGFNGILMSDWGAVHSTIPALYAGTDIEMPGDKYFLKDKVLDFVYYNDHDGNREKILDDKVRRILRVMFTIGLFDHIEKDNGAMNTPEHQKIALDVASESMVLLKNEDLVLPLNQKKIRSIAVIGPNAAVARVGGGGSSEVNPVYSVSPLEGIKNITGEKIKIYSSTGALMETDFPAIDSIYFRPPDSEKAEYGLLGEYFSNQQFTGDPVIKRIDDKIDFDWHRTNQEGMLFDVFSVRWTGKLIPPKTGDYVLCIACDDAGRLFLDDELVIDNWKNHGGLGVRSKKVYLEGTKEYKLKMEYVEENRFASVKLSWNLHEKKIRDEAVKLAKKSDAVIICAGYSNLYETENHDRPDLSLPFGQDEMINAIAKSNKNVIVALNCSGGVNMEKWIDNVRGVIFAWYPGQEGGNALANIIFGKTNPSGKLVSSLFQDMESVPGNKYYPAKDGDAVYGEGIFVGYRHCDKNKLDLKFPFGYGLSYTDFAYSDIHISHERISVGDSVVISCNLKNTGKVPGAEVVQLYVSDLKASVPRPVKELKAFKKVTLKPGDTKTVQFTLNEMDFAYYSTIKKDWTVEPGDFKISIGASSRDIRLDKILKFGDSK